MLASEVLVDKELKAVLDLRFLRYGDVAADSGAANQDLESHLEHLFIIQEETHMRQGAWIATHYFRIA